MSDGVAIPLALPGIDGEREKLLAFVGAFSQLERETRKAAEAGKAGGVTFADFSKFTTEGASALRGMIEALDHAATSIAATAAEGQQLARASARMGLDFDEAAGSSQRFVDEADAMRAATSAAARGLSLTQTELNAFTRAASSYSQEQGIAVPEAFDRLTNAALRGGRQMTALGVEMHGTSLKASSVGERVAALVEHASRLPEAMDDASTSVLRFHDNIDDAGRTFAQSFVEGLARLGDVGRAEADAAEKAADLQRNIRAAGETAAEVALRAAHGVAVVMGSLATGVASILSGIQAIGAGIAHLGNFADRRSMADVMRASFRDSPITQAVGDWTAGHADELERLASEGDQRTSAPAPSATRAIVSGPSAGWRSGPAGPADMDFTPEQVAADARNANTRGRRGAAGKSHAAQELQAQIALSRALSQQEREDLEHMLGLREHDLELQRVGADTEAERHALDVQGLADQMSAMRERQELERGEIGRVQELERLAQARVDSAHGERARAQAQTVLLGLRREELGLAHQIEEQEAAIALAAARAAESEEEHVRAARAAQTARDAFNSHRAAENDPAIREHDRLRGFEQNQQEQRLAGMESFTERMRDLHHEQADSAKTAAETMSGAFATFGEEFGKSIQSVVEGKASFGEAMEAMAVNALATIGKQATAKGAMEIFEGVAMALNPFTAPLAPGHFALGGALLAFGAGLGAAAGAASPATGGGAPSGAGRAVDVSGPRDRPSAEDKGPQVVNHFYAPVIGGRESAPYQTGDQLRRFDDATARRQTRPRA